MALQENTITRRITVVGAGTSGYLTVLYFCKKYPDMQVTWIYPEVNQPIGVGEATVPQVQRFLAELGVSVQDMILHCNANLKIGAMFENWSPTQKSFFHPFGSTDENCLDLEWYLKNNQIPPNILEAYPETLEYMLENDDFPDFATNFDVRELCKYLDKIFENFKNLKVIRKTITDVDEIEDDHIIDATGFSKTLINKTDKENFKSIKHIIPNNKAFVYRAEYSDKENQQQPYTTITAVTHGWIWTIPLKDVITFGHVHDDRYDTKQEYINFVESRLGYKIDESKIVEVKMITGRNIKHFRKQGNKSIYSIGLSSYFIEPIEATGLYLATYGIKLLDRLLKNEITVDEYNNDYNREFDAVTDFITTYYKFSKNSNEYWDHFKKLNIETHRKNNIFPARSWNLILSGMGQEEKKYKIKAERIIKIRKNNVKYSEWLKEFHEKNSTSISK
jgi:flavin-dependent dehydrogenase